MIQVDFIIPTIPPRKRYLERLLKSIDNIITPDDVKKNIIIVDEGGTAGTQRNRGLERSKGDYIYFVDDDDIVMSSFFCQSMMSYLRSRERAVFFTSERWHQPSEEDLKELEFDNTAWTIGRSFVSYKQLADRINMYGTMDNPAGPNLYCVGCYILRSDMKHIKWPTSSQFGEDIIYNKVVCLELARTNPSIKYIDAVKHIYVRHSNSTTWHTSQSHPEGRNMRWWCDVAGK
jgi:hypothetical protein